MSNDRNNQLYAALAVALKAKGVEAIVNGGERLIVARALPVLPKQNSFWVRFCNLRWYLITWAPRAYRLPAEADIVQICLACLDASPEAIATLPADLLGKYGIEELQEEAAQAAMDW